MSALEAVAAEVAGKGPARIQVGANPADTVLVLPPKKWRASAYEDLSAGKFTVWAKKCLDADGYETWMRVDPTVEEVEAFFAEWKDVTGQNLGESSASSSSLKKPAKR